jgi:hypothetical protein
MNKKTPREVKLAWLSGIIDGEGTIAMYLVKNKDIIVQPIYGIYVCNSDIEMINEIKNIYDEIGLKYYFKAKNYKQGMFKQNLVVYELKVSRRNEIEYLLELIIPYLIAKKREAEVIYKFLKENPTSKLLKNRGNRSKKINDNHQTYLETINNFKQARQFGNLTPVETKRETPIL